jgi:CDP-paratose 2-epimerase
MQFRRILITGGAGFVGANLAVLLKKAYPDLAVTAFDNLKRRGSELNLPRLKQHSVAFVHGDIRSREDVDEWGAFDLLIDCSAEPSVQAGLHGSPLGVIHNNLTGTVHCMEAARRHQAAFLFLSTSRVYPIDRLNALAYAEEASRYRWTFQEQIPGFSTAGIGETFPLEGPRSLYGATKLAGELLLKEMNYSYDMPVLINRCGILTGPWQMGKVDQGVVTLWVARHALGVPLRYIGFEGRGKQVRDMLHVEDLFELLQRQLDDLSKWDGRVYNVGGGLEISASLAELTAFCRAATGREVPIESNEATSPVDIRIYATDASRAKQDFAWRPRRSVRTIVEDIFAWVQQHQEELRTILG